MLSKAQNIPSHPTQPSFFYRLRLAIDRLIPHLVLIFFTVLALFPIVYDRHQLVQEKAGYLWSALCISRLPRLSA